ncbi:MAG: DNA-binding MarR family transcriptional regulator [Roseivirga sp.]
MERNIIEELGSLALATRLKNLSERLSKDIAAIYKVSDFDFEPRWFAVIYALKDGNELAVTTLAQMLQQTHPAVNQVANVLVEKKLVIASKSVKDQRKRMLKLSDSGFKLVAEMLPIWEKIHIASRQLIAETAPSFLSDIKLLETSLEEKSMYDRLKGLM